MIHFLTNQEIMDYSKNYIKANEEYQQGNFRLANTIFNRELAINSNNCLAYLGKAKTQTKLGENTEASVNFQKCILNAPPQHKTKFVEGCYSFLLKNNNIKGADQLITSHQSLLSFEQKKEYLLNLILEKNDDALYQFLRNVTIEELKQFSIEVIRNPLISSSLKERLEEHLSIHSEHERQILMRLLKSNEAFINGLNEEFNDIKNEFKELYERISSPFKENYTGLNIIQDSENFLYNRLYEVLWNAEKNRNKILIKGFIEENLTDFENYFFTAATYRTFFLFADSIQLIDENVHESFYNLDLDISLNKEILTQGDFREVLESHNDLKELCIKLEDATKQLRLNLNERFILLNSNKKVYAADKIARFLRGMGEEKPIYKATIDKAQKRRYVKLAAGSILFVIAITAHIICQERFNEYNDYAYANNSIEHSVYLKYIKAHPEGRHIEEIKLNHAYFLYKKAIKSQLKQDIDLLISHYPENSRINTLKFTPHNNLSYALKSLSGDQLKGENLTYKVPTGMPVQYEVKLKNEMIDSGYFQVVSNCTIDTNTTRNLKKDGVYFCNVRLLNVRQDGQYGDPIVEIPSGYPVKYLGVKSERSRRAEFFNNEVDEYYYFIELLGGDKGWVHGGALKDMRFSESIPHEIYKRIERRTNRSIFNLDFTIR